MTLFEELKWRGLVESTTSLDLEKKINEGGLTFYIGTDPTADSLHIGHYSTLLMAKRLQMGGHKPLLLLGGATGLIGDPKPNSERPMITYEALQFNLEGLKKQVNHLFGIETVNNYDWCKDINMIDYLRDYGKHFSVNYMLNKDTVKSRMDIGITYTEFSYMIMQSLDFLHLFQNYNCTLQMGGQDQWGNITAGVELIRRKTGKEAYGLTIPLITKADGTKFGKSESGTLWLDKNKTSAYELYQYFINTEDEKVIEYLKKLTFLKKEEIDLLAREMKEKPEERSAQKRLASEVVTSVHGSEELKKTLKITEVLFKGDIKALSKDELLIALKDVPTFDFDLGANIVDLLVLSQVVTSKREARQFIETGAISINGEKINNIELLINDDYLVEKSILVIRKGKKKYYLGQIKKEIH